MDRPLLAMREAAALAFPDLPPRQGSRRLYRWHQMGCLPPAAVVRIGRGIYLRAGVFRAWLDGGAVNGADGSR